MRTMNEIHAKESALGAHPLPVGWERFCTPRLAYDETIRVESCLVSRMLPSHLRDAAEILAARGARYVKHVKARVGANAFDRAAAQSWSADMATSWFGNKRTAQEVRDALDGRDHASAEHIESLAAEIAEELPPLPSRKRRRTWSEDGGEYDFDRLQDFHDRPAIDRVRSVRNAPGVVHLVAVCVGSAATSAESIRWAGAPALAVAKALISAGYSVALDAIIDGERTGDDSRDAAIRIARLCEPGTSSDVDYAAAAAVVCDAGTYRTVGFLAEACADPFVPLHWGGVSISFARLYHAIADTGMLDRPTWVFEASFSREAALFSAKSALRAIVERVDPMRVLSTLMDHERAARQQREAGAR